MRFWLVASLVVPIAVAAPSAARAELGGGKPKIEIKIPADPENDSASRITTDYVTPATEEASKRYFNMARCLCDDSGDDQLYLAQFSWETRPTMTVSGQLQLYTGVGCHEVPVDERDERCTPLDPIQDVNDLDRTVPRFENVSELLSPSATDVGCDESVTESALNVYTAASGGGGALTLEASVTVPLDLDAPDVPVLVGATAEEGQITLTWDDITSNAADYEYFQALCAHADGRVAHLAPTLTTTRYDTTQKVCGTPIGQLEALTIKEGSTVDNTAIELANLPAELAQLDKKYLCGESSGSAESITLGDLDNLTPYMVVLVAVDKSGNYTARFLPRTVSPKPVTDFWEDVNEDNKDLEGGLCLIESTFGGGAGGGGIYGALRAWRDELATTAVGRWMVERYYGWGAPLAAAAQQSLAVRVVLAVVLVPLIAVALVLHALGLPLVLALIAATVLWRRRRRLVLAFAALVASPALAAAQSNTPYWDDALAVEGEAEETVKWHFGLRLGPFLPSIDESAGLDEQPYSRMFGGGTWMPSMDLHRVWTTRFGQIGAGMSFGYFGKTADAWRPMSNTERAPGNETSLRIVPIEATAIYRLSQLDDNWGIPLVPYARGGLAYSLWWVRRPDGELSKACDGTMAQCDRGIGASAGLVGAVGLAIRAERIDGDAARSMRDSGLDHAGFYAEMSTSWVNGFGSDKKLSLGDTTWSAGVDFEF